MKNTKILYGVEMTDMESMMLDKFIGNNGIAMNTKTTTERTAIVTEWLLGERVKNVQSPIMGKCTNP